MSRPLRIQFENAYYHIISRGDLKRYIFKKDIFKITFMEKMSETFNKFNIECFAYCIMDNHYHLYIKTEEANLSDAMKYLNESYANWYRVISKKPGHVFQGRYKSILIDNDNYSNIIVNYIHLNPVRANIVKKPEEYRFSSLNYYLGNQKRKILGLNKNFILNQFDDNSEIAAKKYYENLLSNLNSIEIEKSVYKSLAIGDELFIKNVEKRLSEFKENDELKSTKMNKTRFPEQILKKIETEFKIDIKEIFANKKNNLYKKIAIYILKKETRMKNQEIADMFGLKSSSISSIIKRFDKEKEGSTKIKNIFEQVMHNAPV